MQFRLLSYRRIPATDAGPLLRVAVLSRALVAYCAKHCDAEGTIPLRLGDPAQALVFRFGGARGDAAVVRRVLPTTFQARCLELRTTEHGQFLGVVDFLMWQRPTREPWRRLYPREEGAFARLPFLARAVAAYLVKVADETGGFGGIRTAAALATHLLRVGGAEPDPRLRDADRKILTRAVQALLVEGFLELLPSEGVVIRNFQRAQGLLDSTHERKGRAEAPAWHEQVEDAGRTENGLKADGERSQGGQVEDAERTPSGLKADEERSQGGQVADAERTPSGLKADEERSQGGQVADVTTQNRSSSSSGTVSYHTSPTVPQRAFAPPPAPPPAPLPAGHSTKEGFHLEIQTPGEKKAKGRKPKLSERPDPPPPDDTLEQKVWDMIVKDDALRPLVVAPADFAMRLVRAFPDVGEREMLGQLHRAGSYASAPKRPIKNGRAFLMNQFEDLVRVLANRGRPAARPAPVNAALREPRPTEHHGQAVAEDPLRKAGT